MARTPKSAVKLLLATGCALSGAVQVTAQATVDFVRDVRPILSQHCFACHGPDRHSREADLDLSRRETALAVIVPGVTDESVLWHRINDQEDPMPPRAAHNELSAEQVDVLRRWIAAGASYAPHWAFVDPVEAELPAMEWSDWPRTRIDQFLWMHWSDCSLSPTADADAATLRRRLNYDLLGLPPSIADVEAFVRDPDLAATVDRLLDSPHFGERMAMMWLDLVRFADTVGYHGDQDHRARPAAHVPDRHRRDLLPTWLGRLLLHRRRYAGGHRVWSDADPRRGRHCRS